MSARLFPALQNCTLSQRMRKCLWVGVVFLAILVYTQTLVMGVRQAPLHFENMLPAEWIPQPLQGFQPPTVPPHFGEEAKPPSVLLHETLSRFNIDPAAVPVAFQEQVLERLHDYTFLYHRDLQDMLHRATSTCR